MVKLHCVTELNVSINIKITLQSNIELSSSWHWVDYCNLHVSGS